MKPVVTSELLSILACPECSGTLTVTHDQLSCGNCKSSYVVKNGIPILFSKKTDIARFQEEMKLAEMMQRPLVSQRDAIIADQWALSKTEFWSVVHKKLPIVPKRIINIGCGLDLGFRDFQDKGAIFINFDIVETTLRILRDQHGARFCVAGDLNYLPFKEHVFDSVVCIDVLHHMDGDLSHYIAFLKRLLRQQGTLFIEDPNAWGLYQIPKSVMLPKCVHGFLRANYHKIMRSTHKPADYEFPISIWAMERLLKEDGFCDVTIHRNYSYPNIGNIPLRIFHFLARYSDEISRYHDFHYLISARNA